MKFVPSINNLIHFGDDPECGPDPGSGLRSQSIIFLNPLIAKLFNLNFHPLEIVSRWCDPQLKIIQIWQNGGQLFSNIADWCEQTLLLALHGSIMWLRPLFFLLCFRWAGALDLVSALQKKHVFFSAQRAHWIVADLRKNNYFREIKKHLKKQVYSGK